MGPLPKEGQIKLTKFQEKTATMTYVYGTSFYWIDVQSHVVLIFSRAHATLQPALSVGRSVGWSIGHTLLFL